MGSQSSEKNGKIKRIANEKIQWAHTKTPYTQMNIHEKTNGGENKAQKPPHMNESMPTMVKHINESYKFFFKFFLSLSLFLARNFVFDFENPFAPFVSFGGSQFTLHEMINITYLAIYFSLYLIHHCAHANTVIRILAFFIHTLSRLSKANRPRRKMNSQQKQIK